MLPSTEILPPLSPNSELIHSSSVFLQHIADTSTYFLFCPASCFDDFLSCLFPPPHCEQDRILSALVAPWMLSLKNCCKKKSISGVDCGRKCLWWPNLMPDLLVAWYGQAGTERHYPHLGHILPFVCFQCQQWKRLKEWLEDSLERVSMKTSKDVSSEDHTETTPEILMFRCWNFQKRWWCQSDPVLYLTDSFFFLTFYFILEFSWLTMLW